MKQTTMRVLMAVVLLVCAISPTHAASPSAWITEYPVPGNPFRVAVEAPGRVWFTLPAQNAIGNLVMTSPGVYVVNTYQLPTANSEPYDIAYAAGAVWVTERIGNKIVRFDPLANQWLEYPILTPASQPTGLTVLAGQPVQVWFVERAGNKLGQYTISDTLTGTLAEFPLPSESQFATAEMEDIASTSSDAVWFTLPGVGLIGHFNLSLWGTSLAFDFKNPRNYPWQYPGITLRPWQIKLDGKGLPWFTEPGTNQLMRFSPSTTANFENYPIPTPDGGLDGLYITQIDMATDEIMAWYTARIASRVGRLHKINYHTPTGELLLPASAPTDIAVDAAGCAWVAAGGTNRVVRWCAPYFSYIYLPLVSKR